MKPSPAASDATAPTKRALAGTSRAADRRGNALGATSSAAGATESRVGAETWATPIRSFSSTAQNNVEKRERRMPPGRRKRQTRDEIDSLHTNQEAGERFHGDKAMTGNNTR